MASILFVDYCNPREDNSECDFQYILPDFNAGEKYTIKFRVLYKEWINQNDIEQEYFKWKFIDE